MNILVTGAAGMIGSHLVKGLLDAGHQVIGFDRYKGTDSRAIYIEGDLGDARLVEETLSQYDIHRIIHLAALAHTAGETDLSYETYHYVNVVCAQNVFKAAKERPVLFVSTVDVYGFTKGVVATDTILSPVTFYGKTKALAEQECVSICNQYTIFRLSPVYTQEVKRDIQKRYYLRYPNIAYRIGKGTEYEVLNIKNAVLSMLDWCNAPCENGVRVIKDSCLMNTAEVLAAEKATGRAKLVLWVPRWLVSVGYHILRVVTGRNKYTYLLHKAVFPLKTE